MRNYGSPGNEFVFYKITRPRWCLQVHTCPESRYVYTELSLRPARSHLPSVEYSNLYSTCMYVHVSSCVFQLHTTNKAPSYGYSTYICIYGIHTSPKGEGNLHFTFSTSHISLNLLVVFRLDPARENCPPPAYKKNNPFENMTGQQAGREHNSNIIYYGNSR